MDKRTSEKIKKQALSVFKENGYEGATMREIAGRIGISAPAIYKHYNSKEDLFEEVIDYCFNKFQEYVDKNAKLSEVQCKHEKLYRIFKTRIDFFVSNKDIYGFLMRFTRFPPDKFHKKIREEIDKARNISVMLCEEFYEVYRNANYFKKITLDDFIASYESFTLGYMGYLAQNGFISPQSNDYLDGMWRLYWVGIFNS